MAQCEKCQDTRFLKINGHTADRCSVSFRSEDVNVEHHGYVPRHIGIGGGDCIRLTICVGCGHVQGWTDDEQRILDVLAGDN